MDLLTLCYILISAHPGIQKVVLASSASDIPVQSPRPLEISVPADLDKTITELADWLVLIDQMLKSNIVTVGDIEEINKTVSRMKVGARCRGLSSTVCKATVYRKGQNESEFKQQSAYT